MDMSMDKPIALNRAEGTKRPQLENAKTIALNRGEGTRGPHVENAKINEKRCPQGM